MITIFVSYKRKSNWRFNNNDRICEWIEANVVDIIRYDMNYHVHVMKKIIMKMILLINW